MNVIIVNRGRLIMIGIVIVIAMMIVVEADHILVDDHIHDPAASNTDKRHLPSILIHHRFYLCMGTAIRECSRPSKENPKVVVLITSCVRQEAHKCVQNFLDAIYDCTLGCSKHTMGKKVLRLGIINTF